MSITLRWNCKERKLGGGGVYKVLKDDSWLKREFITAVKQHAAAVIKTQKLSMQRLQWKPSLATSEACDLESQRESAFNRCYRWWQLLWCVPDDLLLYSFPVVIKNKSQGLLKASLFMISHVRKWTLLRRNWQKKKTLLLNFSPLPLLSSDNHVDINKYPKAGESKCCLWA